MYAHSGNLIKAEEKFKAALELDPDYRSAQLNLGLTYDRQKDRAKSTQYWLEISRIDLETLKPEDFITEGEQQEKE
jgi:Tfp pilus assembly protein PilF